MYLAGDKSLFQIIGGGIRDIFAPSSTPVSLPPFSPMNDELVLTAPERHPIEEIVVTAPRTGDNPIWLGDQVWKLRVQQALPFVAGGAALLLLLTLTTHGGKKTRRA